MLSLAKYLIRQYFIWHELLLELVEALLVGDDLVVEMLRGLLETLHLLGREGLTRDLEATSLQLAGRFWHVGEELVGEDDRFNILHSLSHRWRHVVLLEDLVIRVEGGQHLEGPLLVGGVLGIDPADVETLLGADVPQLAEDDLLHWGLHAVLDANLVGLGAPVVALEDVQEHELVDGRGLEGWQVISVSEAEVVEVLDAHDELGELGAAHLLRGRV